MSQDKTLRQSEDQAVQNTLLGSYCPPLIAEAREAQDALLQTLVTGDGLAIADIGCGDGYHGVMFAEQTSLYHGFEIAPEIARIAREKLAAAGVTHGSIIEGDVTGLDIGEDMYDIAWCLYFTPGNFREQLDDLAEYTDAYLGRNPGFINVVSRFRRALKHGGRMFFTVYQDVPEAEASQVDFYEKTGQHVVTAPGSRFVATAENFWSVRFTRNSMLSNLSACGVNGEDVTFHQLNAIAWLVEVG